MEQLRPFVRFSFWEKRGETHSVVRFATSWATRMEDVEALIQLL
jgi:threonine aldolase